MAQDLETLKQAQEVARTILAQDFALEQPGIEACVQKSINSSKHWLVVDHCPLQKERHGQRTLSFHLNRLMDTRIKRPKFGQT